MGLFDIFMHVHTDFNHIYPPLSVLSSFFWYMCLCVCLSVNCNPTEEMEAGGSDCSFFETRFFCV